LIELPEKITQASQESLMNAPQQQSMYKEELLRLRAIIDAQTTIISSDLPSDKLMQQVLIQLTRLTGAMGGVVELIEGDEMVYRAVSGKLQAFLGLRLSVKSSLSGLCVEQREVLISGDTELDPRVDLTACQKIGARSMIVVPLLYGEHVFGVIKVMADVPAAFDELDVNTLQMMAAPIAAVLGQELESERREQLVAELEDKVSERTTALALELQAHAQAREDADRHLQRLQSHMTNTPLVVIELDCNLNIIEWPVRALDLTGLDKAQVLGKRLAHLNIIHPEDVERTQRHVQRLVRGDSPSFTLEARVCHRNGEVLHTQWYCSGLYNDDGQLLSSLCLVLDITRTKLAIEKLAQSELTLHATFEQAAVGLAHVGLDGRWQRVNQKLCEILGYTRAELLLLTFQDITHADDLGDDLALVKRLLSGEISTYSLEKRYWHKRGHLVWVNLTVSVVRDLPGKPAYFISVIEDITARKATELQLQQAHDTLETRVVERTEELAQVNFALTTEIALRQREEERMRLILESSYDAFMELDERGQILNWNQQATQLFGWQRKEAIGRDARALLIPEDDRLSFDERLRNFFIQIPLHGISGQRDEFVTQHKDGSPIAVEYSMSTIPQGDKHHLVVFAHDISHRKAAQQTLTYQATHDALTGLPNRLLMLNRLQQMYSSLTHEHHPFAVLYLDLDGFKQINDHHGHETGDQLLCAVSERLRGVVRTSDMVARLGGDEFVVLLEHLSDPRMQAAAVAHKLLDAIHQDFVVADINLRIGTSIGIAIACDPQENAQMLLSRADAAMYAAKQSGRNTYRIDDKPCLLDAP
jgi:diguanylate cyclase (GGDEF)-like protein/PAS domain S-box-containing protein